MAFLSPPLQDRPGTRQRFTAARSATRSSCCAAAWQAAHATARTPRDPPAPTRRGVVSRECHSSRIGAIGIAELVAVHIVLVKLPVAILTHQQFRVKYYYSQSSFRTPPVPSVFEDNPVYRRRRREPAI